VRTRAPQIHAAEPRKRRGQVERLNSAFVRMWSGTQTANSSTSAAIRTAAMMLELLPVAVERDAVQLHSMIDEAEAQLFGNPFLQCLKLLVDEFDDIACLDID
jgi:hypothetical protein